MSKFELTVASKLRAVALWEKDAHDDTLLAWHYPALSTEQATVWPELVSQSPLSFVFGKLKDDWLYWRAVEVPTASQNGALRRVRRVALLLTADEFHPEKYDALLKLGLSSYIESNGNTEPVLRLFMEVFLHGADSAKRFSDSEWNPRHALLASSFKDELLTRFGSEDVMLLWSALLLKKRIAVVGHEFEAVQRVVRALPLLAFHRQNWAVLRPCVRLDVSEQAKELVAMATGYVCGILGKETADEIEKNSLFDVVVDVGARRVRGSALNSSVMRFTSFHSTLASLLQRGVDEEGATDEQLVKILLGKTRALLQKLSSIAESGDGSEEGSSKLTKEALAADNQVPSELKPFLWELAMAENIC